MEVKDQINNNFLSTSSKNKFKVKIVIIIKGFTLNKPTLNCTKYLYLHIMVCSSSHIENGLYALAYFF